MEALYNSEMSGQAYKPNCLNIEMNYDPVLISSEDSFFLSFFLSFFRPWWTPFFARVACQSWSIFPDLELISFVNKTGFLRNHKHCLFSPSSPCWILLRKSIQPLFLSAHYLCIFSFFSSFCLAFRSGYLLLLHVFLSFFFLGLIFPFFSIGTKIASRWWYTYYVRVDIKMATGYPTDPFTILNP